MPPPSVMVFLHFNDALLGQVKRHIDAELEFETYFGKVSFEAGEWVGEFGGLVG